MTASRLLAKPNIVAELANKRAIVSADAAIEANDLLRELAAIAFSDVRQLYDEHGNLRPITQLEDAPARAIAAIEVSRIEHKDEPSETIVKVKQWDKLRAIELIGKLRGLFPSEKHLHGHVHVTLEDALEASRHV